jgi:hypothetical protein
MTLNRSATPSGPRLAHLFTLSAVIGGSDDTGQSSLGRRLRDSAGEAHSPTHACAVKSCPVRQIGGRVRWDVTSVVDARVMLRTDDGGAGSGIATRAVANEVQADPSGDPGSVAIIEIGGVYEVVPRYATSRTNQSRERGRPPQHIAVLQPVHRPSCAARVRSWHTAESWAECQGWSRPWGLTGREVAVSAGSLLRPSLDPLPKSSVDRWPPSPVTSRPALIGMRAGHS